MCCSLVAPILHFFILCIYHNCFDDVLRLEVFQFVPNKVSSFGDLLLQPTVSQGHSYSFSCLLNKTLYYWSGIESGTTGFISIKMEGKVVSGLLGLLVLIYNLYFLSKLDTGHLMTLYSHHITPKVILSPMRKDLV